MSDKVWLGRIYIREEGGYEIVLRALTHYRKRLTNISSFPQLKDAPMFAQIVQHEAMKTVPAINVVIEKIQLGLREPASFDELQNDIPFIEKALDCYQSDIQKAQHGDTFYAKALEGNNFVNADFELIKNAMQRIKQFC
ncbi:MAG: hypothetical protein QW652_03440 [Candidatus Nitrosotenuis sp.]